VNKEVQKEAKSLVESLDARLSDVVRKAVEGSYTELDRDPQTVFRSISDTQRLQYSLDYVFLDERENWLLAEQERLKRKYLELKKAIEAEMAEITKEKERLLLAIRYQVIRDSLIEKKSSAPTNVL
jgi:hypothetical protein